ncbi:MAG TPA: phosphatase PAP2 family protein [Micromonosporaceae bacterium]|nr:phosphatase PAP2 family protein [Micromonosporaceae bacterium]
MQELRTVRRRARLRPVRPAGWWFDALLLAAAIALTVALANGVLLDLDLAVRDWGEANRSATGYWIARVFNFLGQSGWLLMPLTGALAVLVSVRTRSVRPLLVMVATIAVIYLTVGSMKLLLHRGYPRNFELAHPERLFSDPVGGMAYPSGHVVNTIVWYWAIALLLAALLRVTGRSAPAWIYPALRTVPPAIVFVTTIYLNYHWVTDSIAGLLVGVLLERLLARVPWDDVPLPALPRGLERPGVFTSTS